MTPSIALNPTPEAIAAAQAAAAALPLEAALEPNVPVPVYLHQATVLVQVAERDGAKLRAVGCDAASLDSLDARVVVLRDADAAWQMRRAGKGEPQAARELAAVALRDQTLADARWWLRANADVQGRLDSISEGDGLPDTLQDLEELALLLGDHGAKVPATATFLPAERALACRAAAEAARQGDAARKADVSNEQLKLSRDKAFAFADAAVKEVRAAGRYAFKDVPQSLVDYRDAYNVAQQRRLRKKRDAEQAAGGDAGQ